MASASAKAMHTGPRPKEPERPVCSLTIERIRVAGGEGRRVGFVGRRTIFSKPSYFGTFRQVDSIGESLMSLVMAESSNSYDVRCGNSKDHGGVNWLECLLLQEMSYAGERASIIVKALKLTQKVHTFHFLDLAHATLCNKESVGSPANGLLPKSKNGGM